MFTLANCSILIIKAIYAIQTDSLSLQSDAGHMLCDILALIISLIVVYIKQINLNKENKSWLTENIEYLAGFGNGLFLLTLAVNISIESLDRYYNGVEQYSEEIVCPLALYNNETIAIACSGLLLNIAGLYIFNEEDKESSLKNQNQYALFLHYLADAFSSISTLAAALLVRVSSSLCFADTICAQFTALTIVISIMPALKISFSKLFLSSAEER